MGPLRPKRPSHHVAGYLATNEHVVLEMKQHWARVLPAVGSCALGFFLVLVAGVMAPASLGFLTNAAWWIWLVLLAHLAWRVLEWWDETFVITNKRLILVHGLFVKKVAMMPLSKVTDMSYNRSPAARILGYGTFVMESAGQEQALDVVDYVRDPDVIYRTLCGLIFGADEPSPADRLPTEPPTWDEPDDAWADEPGSPHWDDQTWDPRRRATDEWEDSSGDEGWHAADDIVDEHASATQPLPVLAQHRRSEGHRPSRPTRRDDQQMGVLTHRDPLDDTDPYGVAPNRWATTRTQPNGPESHDSSAVGPAWDDEEDDSAWTVSREHATSPQAVHQYRNVDNYSTWRDTE